MIDGRIGDPGAHFNSVKDPAMKEEGEEALLFQGERHGV
jgi:hypothetical protein